MEIDHGTFFSSLIENSIEMSWIMEKKFGPN